jgi:hypothetical protein
VAVEGEIVTALALVLDAKLDLEPPEFKQPANKKVEQSIIPIAIGFWVVF